MEYGHENSHQLKERGQHRVTGMIEDFDDGIVLQKQLPEEKHSCQREEEVKESYEEGGRDHWLESLGGSERPH